MISDQSNDDFMLLVLWLFNTCERNPFSGIKIRNILLQDVIFLQSITELSDEEGGEASSNHFASVRFSQTLVEGGSEF